MSVTIFLGKALICFQMNCYPMLYGDATPVGTFQIQERRVLSPGYGGDVLQFHDAGDMIFSVHRTWLGSPNQKRVERLESETPTDNKISNGCINIAPEVYEALKDCCTGQSLTIQE